MFLRVVVFENQVSYNKIQGKLEIEDLKTVKGEDGEGNVVDVCFSASTGILKLELMRKLNSF
jgi:hypothetical protein